MDNRTRNMERIGDLAVVKKVARTIRASGAADERFLDAVEAIRTGGPDAVEAAFMARQLVQCTFPHRNPGDVPTWKRTNGNLTLGLVPGVNVETGESYGYPYGTLPRLVLFWIVTEVVRTKARRLQLGNHLNEFMRQLDLSTDTGGGKRGNAKRLTNQMQRLFQCRISFQQTHDQHAGMAWLNMDVAPKGELWWSPKDPNQTALWGSWIELGEQFYEAILAAPVPVDMRALRALKRSPLQLDLYAWLTLKLYQANRKGQAQFVPWDGLMLQLGTGYESRRIDRFKDKVKTATRKVKSVFPEGISVGYSRRGMSIKPGKALPVSPRAQRI